ncbi:MAG: hydrogenase formation protein HypD [Euryarchaeota archaeon]|nr:hydrogenase formation protein HypD [Euryarchaeota archaeon]
MFRYRDEKAAQKIIESIRRENVKLRFMHVCGTHQDTLVRFGLERMLQDVGVEIRQGPGCPVCVTTSNEVAEAIALANAGVTISVFGDMLKVPTPLGSLGDARARGADVRIVYSVEDAVRLAREVKEMVFMAIGFETTSPTTAAMMVEDLPDNFSVLSCHRLLPPALEAIIKMGEFRIDGLIEPGHVSVMIGEEPYHIFSERDKIPQVIAGFEPLDLLMASYMLVRQVKEGRAEVENEYRRLVREEGNPRAVKLLEEVFVPVDRAWRGFPVIPKSAYELRPKYDDYNARKVYQDILEKRPEVKEELGGCRCGEVLRGLIDSEQCPAFGRGCTPAYPMGPCMVSREGGCNIAFRYRGKM